MDPNTLAQNFLNEYYGAQSNNRANLINFYNEGSCLSYNGDHFKGLQKIKEKIESLGFNKVNTPSILPKIHILSPMATPRILYFNFFL